MPSLAFPCLMVVTDRRQCRSLLEAVCQAVEGGANMVQLREKELSAAEQLDLGAQLQERLQGRARLIINDRADVALALGADGVQLPETGLPVEAARRILGPQTLIGRSVHSLAGALAAQRAGADYLVFGPVFATGSHPEASPAGAGALREVSHAIAIPVLAIGGVTAENVREVLGAGAFGIAVITAVLAARDPKAAAAELAAAMATSPARG